MNQAAIFIPFFAMMLLTIIVWFYMYVLRLSYFKREKIDPQSIGTMREMYDRVPARIHLPSENLVNLFELPILFYGVCVYLYVTQQVDMAYLFLAYGFVFLRAGHSLIHCTYNRVMQRFLFYSFSSLLLWVMIIRAGISALGI